MRGRRRAATGLVLAALVGLGVAAGVDALREDRKAESVSRPRASPPAVTAELRDAGLSGIITYSDERCRLHAVRLPGLEPAPAPAIESCRPRFRSGGITAWNGDLVWSGLGFRTVQVVLTRRELSRAIAPRLGLPRAGSFFRAVQAVWLGDRRYVVLADSTYAPRERVLAAFDGERLRFVHPRWVVGGARSMRPSPRGGYYALVGAAQAGVRLFTRDGRALEAPRVAGGWRAVAWSPDERWTAVATGSAVYVFRTQEPGRRVLRIPLAVRDLAWSA
jgi:hypothetical protein